MKLEKNVDFKELEYKELSIDNLMMTKWAVAI